MGEGISLRELARRIGRSAPTLGELAKKGKIPRNADGTYDEAAVRAAYVRNSDPAQRKALKRKADEVAEQAAETSAGSFAAAPDGEHAAESLMRRILLEEGREPAVPLSYDDVQTAGAILKARKNAQEIAVAEGELLRKGPVLKHIEEAFANYRKELQSLPARFGAQIAAEVGCDVAVLDAALSKVIRAHLESLSAPVVKAQ